MKLPEILDALNKAGYIDDDIWCEDNTEVVQEYDKIIGKYKHPDTIATYLFEMLVKRNYIQNDYSSAFGFIYAYFYFLDKKG